MLAHRVSFVNDLEIDGLVIDLDNPTEPPVVEISFDGLCYRIERVTEGIDYRYFRFIGEPRFAALREKLAGETVVPGRFRYAVPSRVYNSRGVDVRVVEQSSGTVLLDERRDFIENYVATIARETKNVVTGILQPVEIAADRLTFTAMFNAIADEVDLDVEALDGVLLEKQVIRLNREEACQTFDKIRQFEVLKYIEGAKSLLVHGILGLQDGKADFVRLVASGDSKLVIPPSTGIPVPPHCYSEFNDWRVPTDARMHRVMGYSNPVNYYLGGYATFQTIDAVLGEFLGCGIADCATVLDWGCGCGRLTQHLVRRLPSARIIGIDIDGDNVEWCRNNIPGGEFDRIALLPPTGLPDQCCDLAIGISVVTHLSEAAEESWLRELDRVLRPGGIALLTVQSLHHLAIGGWLLPQWFRDFNERGISDGHVGVLLDEVLPADDPLYYRETGHSHRYIEQNWGRFFDVIGVKIGAHFNNQDMVVLRKSQARASSRITY